MKLEAVPPKLSEIRELKTPEELKAAMLKWTKFSLKNQLSVGEAAAVNGVCKQTANRLEISDDDYIKMMQQCFEEAK